MDQAERREFVRQHRTAVFGFARRADGPAMSIVYYVMDGDDLLVGTMAERGKAKAVRRNPKVSMAVLNEKWPLTYLLVYGDARLETDIEFVTDVGMRVMGLMAEKQIADESRARVREMGIAEGRVVIRVTPYATFETPPRHVYNEGDLDTLTHWTSSPIAWR